MSIDKLWALDYTINPYHYSHNNPISLLDPSGYFSLSDHTSAIVSNGFGNSAFGFINWVYNDALNFNVEYKHFDNKQNYGDIMEVINEANQ